MRPIVKGVNKLVVIKLEVSTPVVALQAVAVAEAGRWAIALQVVVA